MNRRAWSKQAVIEAIRSRHERGLPLVSVFRHDHRLFTAAVHCFGSWHDAVVAAGFRPTRRRWSRDRVIEAIRDRHARGLKLTYVSKDDSGLEAAARKYFGSWAEAVFAAGVKARLRTSWSKQRVVGAIQARHDQRLAMTGVWKGNKSLYLAAHRHFGGWQKALEASGFPADPLNKWSRERVIKELRACERLPYVNLRKHDTKLASAVRKYFGSLRKARMAAGLEPRRRKWSRQRVIDAIQDARVKGQLRGLSSRNPRLSSAGQRLFGGWRKALLAAGVKPPHHETWTRQRVISEIRSRYERGLSLTSVWREYATLSAAGRRYFGGWSQARAAAGFTQGEGKTDGRSNDRTKKGE